MNELKQHPISITEIYKARQAISKQLSPSPLVRYEGLSRLLGFDAWVKHENQNITGSFKIRGGLNLMAHLKAAGANGVVSFSTGNHGLSIATSARIFGVPAIVVVPEGANPVKIELIRQAGAEVIAAGKNFDESAAAVAKISEERGYYYAHPADEPHLINGVGTEFVEIVETLPEVDAVILPLGAGSEVAAAVTALKAIAPRAEVYAVQAARSSAGHASWSEKKILTRPNETFAGGFATGTAYETTFQIYKEALADFVLLSEDEIMQGIALAAHYTKNLVEGAGGASILAAWKLRERLANKRVVLQFSGANASPEELRQAYRLEGFVDGRVR